MARLESRVQTVGANQVSGGLGSYQAWLEEPPKGTAMSWNPWLRLLYYSSALAEQSIKNW